MIYWRRLLFSIRSSFWFLPGMMALLAVVAGVLFANYEFGFDVGAGFTAVTPGAGMPVESARAILATIVGTMITVTTLVFSMTLVALTLVAQQLGPRIVLRFMDDRPTQIFLGLFLATFLFALVVLVRVGYAQAEGQVPNIAVLLSSSLVIVSTGAVIAFIHNVANRIQADQLVAELGDEFEAAAGRLVSHGDVEKAFASSEEVEALESLFGCRYVVPVSSGKSGYLNVLDEETALETAAAYDAVVRIAVHPGEFVLTGTPVLEVALGRSDEDFIETVKADMQEAISVAAKRTAEATLEFEVNALTEVALRALSPGINDPYTARTCIHRLGVGLRQLLDHPGRPAVRRDGEGRIRVVHHRQPFGYYCALALRPLMNSGRDHAEVLAEIADMLGALGAMTHREDRFADIVVNLDALEETLDDCRLIATDKAWVREHIDWARQKARAGSGLGE